MICRTVQGRSALRALLIVVALVLAHGARAGAAVPSVDPSEFAARLDHAIALATDDLQHPSPDAMIEVRVTVGLPVTMNLPGGVVSIAGDRLLDSLKGASSVDFARVIERLRIINRGLVAAEGAQTSDPSRADVANALRGVKTSPSFLQRLRELWDALLQLLTRGFSTVAGSGWGSILFVVIGSVLVLSLIVFALRRVRTVQERSIRGGRPAAIEDPVRELEDALARGDLVGAIRAQFRLLVHELAVDGVVPESPSLTAGECRVAVRSRARAASPLVDEATDAFERVVYGRGAATPADVEALREAERAARAA